MADNVTGFGIVSESIVSILVMSPKEFKVSFDMLAVPKLETGP